MGNGIAPSLFSLTIYQILFCLTNRKCT